MKEGKKAPKLRFKGFTDDWEQRKLKDVLDISKTKNKAQQYGKVDVLSVSREVGTVNQIKYQGRSFAGSDLSNYKVVQGGELIYTKSPLKGAPYGIFQVATIKGIISPLYAVYTSTDKAYTPFVATALKNDNIATHYLTPLVTKGAKNTINVTDEGALEGKIQFPSILEQKQIFIFFKQLDDIIALHEEKKRQLELLKSALLQKMFADKSGYPAVRFEGFSDEWEQCKLSDISEKSYEKNTDNKYSTVLTNSAEYGIVKQRDFFDKDIANSSNISGYYVVRKNYFIYNPRISNQAKFGPINRNKLDETGIMSPLYLVFTVHNIDESFLETLFQTTTWHRFMYQNGDTGARADRFAIKDSTFMSMPIKVPTLEEQHKLAFAFQKLDRTITLHVQKLSLLKRVKQTLLQKMFI